MGKYEEILLRSNTIRQEEEKKKIQEEHEQQIKKLTEILKAKRKLADILSDVNNIKDLEIEHIDGFGWSSVHVIIILNDKNISDDVYYVDNLFKIMEDVEDKRTHILNDNDCRPVMTIRMIQPFLNEICCAFHNGNKNDKIDDLMEKLIEELRK